MSTNDSNAEGPLVFGVPGSTIAAALREAGLSEDAVIAVLGQAISRSAAGAEREAAGFTFQVQIAETAPECVLTYERLFVHPDFIDGVTVVQGGQTPDEIGFNARFHALEGELDSISRDLHTSSNCVAELRREVFQLTQELEAKITEIDSRLDAKGKDKEAKEGKESKEGKEGKETKEKDSKEGKDKEGKDHKEHKDKDHIDKVSTLEKLVAIEKQLDTPLVPNLTPGAPTGRERTFITLDDRPDVGATALDDEPPPPPAKKTAKKAAKKAAAVDPAAGEAAPVKKAVAKKAPAKKAAAVEPAADEAAPVKKAAAKKAPAKKAPAKKAPAKKAPGKKAPAKKAAAVESASGEAAAVKKAAAKAAPAKKAVAKKAAASPPGGAEG
jgi:hypothetical protein